MGLRFRGRLFQRNPYLEEGRKALEMESTTPKQKKLQYNTFGCSQENADQKVTNCHRKRTKHDQKIDV